MAPRTRAGGATAAPPAKRRATGGGGPPGGGRRRRAAASDDDDDAPFNALDASDDDRPGKSKGRRGVGDGPEEEEEAQDVETAQDKRLRLGAFFSSSSLFFALALNLAASPRLVFLIPLSVSLFSLSLSAQQQPRPTSPPSARPTAALVPLATMTPWAPPWRPRRPRRRGTASASSPTGRRPRPLPPPPPPPPLAALALPVWCARPPGPSRGVRSARTAPSCG